jgi:hypothetical protein
VLADLGIPATVGVVTGSINGTFDGRLRNTAGVALPCLTGSQIRELHRGGWDIASQTVTHADLNHLPSDDVAIELRDSRKALEDLLGQSISTLALPTDSVEAPRPQIIEHAREHGYETILCPQSGFVGRAALETGWPRIALTSDVATRLRDDVLPEAHRAFAGWPQHAEGVQRDDAARRVNEIVAQCRRNEWSRVAVYGVGRDTRRWLSSDRLWPLRIEAVIDDRPDGALTSLDGVPIRPLSDLSLLNVEAVIVPADQAERAPGNRNGSAPAFIRVTERRRDSTTIDL